MSPKAPVPRALWLVGGASLVPPAVTPGIVVLDLRGVAGEPGALAPTLEAARKLARHGVFVMVSPLAAGRFEAEAAAVLPARPDAVVLPGCTGGCDVQQCGVKLGVIEAERGWEAGAIGVVAAPDAAGLLALRSFRGASPRLRALLLDGAMVGPGGNNAVVESLLLLGAQAAAVPAYRMALPAPGDADRARASGFAGLLTREPAEIAVIEGAFALSAGA